MNAREHAKKQNEVTAELTRLTAHAEALARKRSQYLLDESPRAKANVAAIERGSANSEVYDNDVARLLAAGPNLTVTKSRITELTEILEALEREQPDAAETKKAEADVAKLCAESQAENRRIAKAHSALFAALGQIEAAGREKVDALRKSLAISAEIRALQDRFGLEVSSIKVHRSTEVHERYLITMSAFLRELAGSVPSLSSSLLAELNAAKEAMKIK